MQHVERGYTEKKYWPDLESFFPDYHCSYDTLSLSATGILELCPRAQYALVVNF